MLYKEIIHASSSICMHYFYLRPINITSKHVASLHKRITRGPWLKDGLRYGHENNTQKIQVSSSL